MQWPCNEAAPTGTPLMHVDGFQSGRGHFVITEYIPTDERTGPRFPLLLTSEAPVRLPGGTVWRVPPMALPVAARNAPPPDPARAEAVRKYLVGTAGLSSEQVRAVSYDKDENRQVRPGAVGDAGQDNRRVGLVVDYAGPRTDGA